MERLKVTYLKGKRTGETVLLPKGLANVFLKTGKVELYKELEKKLDIDIVCSYFFKKNS